MISRMYTITASSLHEASNYLQQILGVRFQARDSDYFGDYFRCKSPLSLQDGGWEAKLMRNFTPFGDLHLDKSPREAILLELSGNVEQSKLDKLRGSGMAEMVCERSI